MALRSIDLWPAYLDDALALWTELGDDFEVGRMAREQAVEVQSKLTVALDKVTELEAQLGLAKDERDKVLADVQGFATKFRAAVVATYGARSSEARRVPKASGRRARRGRRRRPRQPEVSKARDSESFPPTSQRRDAEARSRRDGRSGECGMRIGRIAL